METQKITLELDQQSMVAICAALYGLISYENTGISESEMYMQNINTISLFLDESAKKIMKMYENQAQELSKQLVERGTELANHIVRKHNEKTGDNISEIK